VLTLEPAFVGTAALIGPAIRELVPDTSVLDLRAEGPTQAALSAAIAECLRHLPPEQRPASGGAPAGGSEDDGDAAPGDANGNDAQRSEAQRKREPAATLSSLRKLNVNTIFDDSKRGVQHALHQLRDQRVADGKPHAAKQRARFLECSREHASAWLTSSRRDRSCCMVNGLFRIAVAIRVGVNPFEGVPSTYLCAWCKEPVGDDLYSHCIECKSARKGDNNRRHQQLQQVLVNLARAVGEGRVMTVPQVLAFFGAGAHETGHPPPVRARARANHRETEEQNSRRQGDFGLVEVFRRGQLELVDLTVSDGGGAEPGASYEAGKLCIQRAIQKRDT
jgi:hypothetical protein